jgi:hypothetical protein
MFDFVSPVPKYLFGAVLIAIIIYFIVRSIKKDRAAALYERNLATLPPETRALYDALKLRDSAWFEQFGNALDATQLTDPLHIAVDAGWSALDDAEELLNGPRFIPETEPFAQFRAKLESAAEQFDIADREKAQRALEEEA